MVRALMKVDWQLKGDTHLLPGITNRAAGSAPATLGFLPGTREPFDAAISQPVRQRTGWEHRYAWGVLAIDATSAAIAGILGYLLRFYAPDGPAQLRYLGFTACLPLIWVLLLAANRAYERRYLYVGSEETRRVFRSGIMLVAAVAFLAYAFRQDFSRGYLLGAFPLLVVSSAFGRYALRKGLHRRRDAGLCMERTIVVGHPRPM